MSRDTGTAEAGMKGVTFPAWHGKHYVTLAELLVRLGSFGLDLTWRVEFDEIVDPRCVETGKRSADVPASRASQGLIGTVTRRTLASTGDLRGTGGGASCLLISAAGRGIHTDHAPVDPAPGIGVGVDGPQDLTKHFSASASA